MTRKDYQLIANAIRGARAINQHPEAQDALDILVHRLTLDLNATNPLFDAAKFRAACNKVGK